MAYKSTGRPVGRPKTKEYKTLLARVPADLAELVKQYARQHGQSVAELLREGVEWRVGDGDPRGMGMYLAQPTDSSEKVYYTNTEKASGVESSAVLEDMRTALARQEAQIQALTQMLEQQTALLRSNVYSSNTPIGHGEQESRSEHAPAGEGEGFDPARFRLGKLCKRGHAYHGTGQTLYRLPRFVCPECDAEGARKRRKAKREGQPVQG